MDTSRPLVERLGWAVGVVVENYGYGRGHESLAEAELLEMIASLDGEVGEAVLKSDLRAVVALCRRRRWYLLLAKDAGPQERAFLLRKSVGCVLQQPEPGPVLIDAMHPSGAPGLLADAFALVDLLPTGQLSTSRTILQKPHGNRCWPAAHTRRVLHLRLDLWRSSRL